LQNVKCLPILNDIEVNEFLEKVKQPNYYKQYVKPKVQSEGTDLTYILNKLAQLDQKYQELEKRTYIHPLEIGDVQSAKSLLQSIEKIPNRYGIYVPMDLFKNTYIIDQSPFYAPGLHTSHIHVLWNENIVPWDKRMFVKFMTKHIFNKITEICPSFEKWIDEMYDFSVHDNQMWEEAVRALCTNNFKRYHKKIFSVDCDIVEDEEDVVNTD